MFSSFQEFVHCVEIRYLITCSTIQGSTYATPCGATPSGEQSFIYTVQTSTPIHQGLDGPPSNSTPTQIIAPPPAMTPIQPCGPPPSNLTPYHSGHIRLPRVRWNGRWRIHSWVCTSPWRVDPVTCDASVNWCGEVRSVINTIIPGSLDVNVTRNPFQRRSAGLICPLEKSYFIAQFFVYLKTYLILKKLSNL